MGDASLGEWVEHWPGSAFHLRRRLSAREQQLVGEVVDIRGDEAEVARRLKPLAHLLPEGYRE